MKRLLLPVLLLLVLPSAAFAANNSSVNITANNTAQIASLANNSSANVTANNTSRAPIPQSNFTTAESFAQFLLPNGTYYSVEKFTLGSSNAQAIVSGGEVYAIFAPTLPFYTIRPLSGQDEVYSALGQYYASKGYSLAALGGIKSAHEGIANISTAYQKGENKCRVLTGTDRSECTSFLSCQRACYSVTSFCLQVALGTGREFINIIWEFENSSRLLTSAYADENSAYAALEANRTAANYEAYLSSIGEVNRAATRASLSPLYTDYSYCFKPDYSLAKLTALQLEAQNAYAQGSPLLTLSENADRVRNRTLEGLARKAAYDAALEAIKNRSLAANKSNSLLNQTNATSLNKTSLQNSPNATSIQPVQPSPYPAWLLSAVFVGTACVAGAIVLLLMKLRRKKR